MAFRIFLNKRIKKILKSVIKNFPGSVREEFLQLLLKDISSTERVLRNLKVNGYSPTLIIDYGAYVGDWTRMIRNIFPNSNVLMVEANPEKEQDLQKVCKLSSQSVDYEISLLGAASRPDVKFYKMETGSSIMEEQSNIPRDVLSLPMKTLDEVAAQRGLFRGFFR